MAEPKTRPTDQDPAEFLQTVEPQHKRLDCFEILEIMKDVSKEKPTMWGSSIIGFGTTPMTYSNGNVLDWPTIGFSPRKQNITLYVLSKSPKQEALLKKLGKYTTGSVCLYIKRLSDVNKEVLKELIRDCYETVKSVKGL